MSLHPFLINFQKKVKINKLHIYFNILNLTNIEFISFEEICLFINDSNNLDFLMILIKSIIDYNKLNKQIIDKLIIDKRIIRKIYSSFLIVNYSSDIFNSPNKDDIIEKTIYSKAHKIQKYLKLLEISCKNKNIFETNMYSYKFVESLMDYLKYFDIWKKIDKLFLLKNLYELYFEFEQFKQLNNLNTLIENNVKVNQSNIIYQINKLKKDKSFEINKELNDAYWFTLKEEIKNNKYDKFLDIMTNIKDLLCIIVPSRIDIHLEINEILDIDFIKHKTNDNDNKYIFDIINYILDKIESYQSSNEDANFKIWKDSLYQSLKSNVNYYDFLPDFLKEVMSRLRQIYIDSKKFKDLLKK